MSKLCKSFERYWDLEARHKKLNPHVDTIFEEDLSMRQGLRIVIAVSLIAIAIIVSWSIVL